MPDATQTQARRAASRWRLATIVSLMLLALCVAAATNLFEQGKAQIQHLQSQLQTTERITHLAMLLDAQHQPAVLVTLAAQQGLLEVQRLNEVKEGRADSLQLWAIDDQGHTQSLGVITPKLRTAQLALPSGGLKQTVTLAISVEDKGGVNTQQGPRLPYLFQGRWIQKAL
jgi:anti-sigma-K factor RskA